MSFKLFEYYLPRFFHGAAHLLSEIYGNEGEDANRNVNHGYVIDKRNITENMLTMLMEDPYILIDIEIYSFVQRRFNLQLNHVLELEKKKIS